MRGLARGAGASSLLFAAELVHPGRDSWKLDVKAARTIFRESDRAVATGSSEERRATALFLSHSLGRELNPFEMDKEKIKGSHVFLVLAFVAFFGAPFLTNRYFVLKATWLITLVLMLGVLAMIQRAVGMSLLTDERGRWSLSRLQLLSWTGFLIPTIWSMAVLKFQAGAADPLALGMNDNLWALLGISAASLVGSPILLERKSSGGTLDMRARADASGKPNTTSGEFSDFVRGEETGNAGVIDISRVQLFLFTAMALFVYFILCWREFTDVGAASLQLPSMSSVAAVSLQLPSMSVNLVTLIGISHATYLAGKIPKHP
jgi:hypothetical protein